MNTSRLPALLPAILLCAGCVTTSVAGEPRYGVCRAEIARFVEQQLGQTVTRIDMQAYAEQTPPGGLLDVGNALAFVEECNGFHSFEVRGTWSLCEHVPHYGFTGSYIRYEGGYEGCKNG